MREEMAEKLRRTYWGDRMVDPWEHSDMVTKGAWLAVADVAISMIETTVAHARPTEKTTKMRHALWNIIEEAQIALKAD